MFELSDDTYVKETGSFLEVISKDKALQYKLNMSEYLEKIKTS